MFIPGLVLDLNKKLKDFSLNNILQIIFFEASHQFVFVVSIG
jgi:hypothetical protein